MQHFLKASKWGNFSKVIEKAKEAYRNAGHSIDDHFHDARKMVKLSPRTESQVEYILLTRYPYYFIAQNRDPRKKQITFILQYKQAILNFCDNYLQCLQSYYTNYRYYT